MASPAESSPSVDFTRSANDLSMAVTGRHLHTQEAHPAPLPAPGVLQQDLDGELQEARRQLLIFQIWGKAARVSFDLASAGALGVPSWYLILQSYSYSLQGFCGFT